jgi:hypothetical protein
MNINYQQVLVDSQTVYNLTPSLPNYINLNFKNMKGYYKVFALITLILVLITITNAQQITYNDSWGTHGFSLLEDDGNFTWKIWIWMENN